MGPTEHSSHQEDSESATLELYKAAATRLTFQDEYLFKFSAVFLTAHGALAVLAGSAFFRTGGPHYQALGVVSVIGLILALVWFFWTRHNDYWHAVWTGALRSIELNHLNTKARVFAAEHAELAKQGGRSGRLLPSGHTIAQLVPVAVGLAWAFSICIAL